MKELPVKILYSEVLKTYGVVYAHNHLKALRGSYESTIDAWGAVVLANMKKDRKYNLTLNDWMNEK